MNVNSLAVPGSPKWRTACRIFVNAARLTCIGMLVGAAIWSARGWRSILQIGSTRDASAGQPVTREPVIADQAMPILRAPGTWVFAGSQWGLSISKLSEDEANRQLRNPPPVKPELPPITAQERDAVRLLERLPGESQIDGTHRHDWRGMGLRVVCFTRRLSGDTRLIYAGVIVPTAVENVRLFEIFPHGRTAQPIASAGLLPLPSEATRLLTRLDAENQCQFELAILHRPMTEVRKLWQEAGWRLYENPECGQWFCVGPSYSVHALAGYCANDGAYALALLRMANHDNRH